MGVCCATGRLGAFALPVSSFCVTMTHDFGSQIAATGTTAAVNDSVNSIYGSSKP